MSTSSSTRGPVPEPEKKSSDQNGKSEHDTLTPKIWPDARGMHTCACTHMHIHSLTFSNVLCLPHFSVACTVEGDR